MFDRLAIERLEAWTTRAEERLAGTPVRLYVTGGNDDTDEVLAVLEKMPLEQVVACEGKVVALDEVHTIASLGYSTPTPWKTPRERTEEELTTSIEELVAAIPDPARCVFNFHVPPIDSGLDTCALLDESVWPPAPVVSGGQPVEFGAGSSAVRDAIEQVQPSVGLHGHIHESKGIQRYGRSPAINPGSSYNDGVLKGVIVTLADGEVRSVQFTSG
jgi:Icc-related predicted phosphoesterase